MKRIARALSALALAGTLLPSLLFFGGAVELEAVKSWMLAATGLWFATAPFWMDGRSD